MDANIKLANEEMVTRLERAVMTLNQLENERTTDAEKVRLAGKAAGVQFVLDKHRERLQNMRNENDLLFLAAMIDPEMVEVGQQEGVNLARGYLLEYAN